MKIMFYGDSNTYGYDPRGPIPGRYEMDKRWTTIVANALGPDYQIISEGMNGRKIPAREMELGYFFKDIEINEPLDMVGIMLGTNDYLFASNRTVQMVTDRMRIMIEETRKRYPDLKILLMTPPPIEMSHMFGAEECDTTDEKLAKAYEDLASELDLMLFDGAKEDMDIAFDGAHLTEKGHAQLGERLSKFLLDNLGK